MKITIHTDGGSLSNPGEAGIGFVINGKDGLIYEYCEAIGIASNNVAEYTALIKGLNYILTSIENKSLSVSEIEVIADSELMIKQIRKEYKVKNGNIEELMNQLRPIIAKIPVPIRFTHVKREYNKYADMLVKRALNRN